MIAEVNEVLSQGFWVLMVPSLAALVMAVAGWINSQKAKMDSKEAIEKAVESALLAQKTHEEGKVLEVKVNGRLTELFAMQRDILNEEGERAKTVLKAAKIAKEALEKSQNGIGTQ